jgi:hypothetical protein
MNFDLTKISLDAANVIAAWTAVCAAVSLVNKYLVTPYLPNVARGLSAVLSIMPGHVGQLITDIEAIVADIRKGPPAAPPGSPTATTTPDATPKPPATTRGRIGLAMAGSAALFALTVGAFSVTTTGCVKLPPNVPTDVENALSCAAGSFINQTPIQPCIDQYGQALVDDAFTILMNSLEFKNSQPAAYSRLGVYRAQNSALGH